jgi:hypothetical protein
MTDQRPDPAILELARMLAREAARNAFDEAIAPSAERQSQSEEERLRNRRRQYVMQIEKLSDCERITLIPI